MISGLSLLIDMTPVRYRRKEITGNFMPLNIEDFNMFASPAFAQAAGGGFAGGLGGFMPLILIFGIMYFLMIRPQQKKVKQHQAMVAAVRKGDQIVTAGGLIGKITKVNADNEVEVEISSGVKVKVVQHTISQVLNKTEPAK
jgi:preprotein translocase subunit YajC|tara:strand:- start:263 stop:688 length:426 start_codon:yes stop_codon:yes gene_type:complete